MGAAVSGGALVTGGGADDDRGLIEGNIAEGNKASTDVYPPFELGGDIDWAWYADAGVCGGCVWTLGGGTGLSGVILVGKPLACVVCVLGGGGTREDVVRSDASRSNTPNNEMA